MSAPEKESEVGTVSLPPASRQTNRPRNLQKMTRRSFFKDRRRNPDLGSGKRLLGAGKGLDRARPVASGSGRQRGAW